MHVVPIRTLDDVEDPSVSNEIRVFSAGKAESAFVWWVMDKPVESEEITGWEVYRYCHYPGSEKNDEWFFEGKMYVDGSHCRSCLVRDLNDSCMYRFSVRCLYANVPPLAESVPSAPCMVESPLPAGWLRIFDSGNRSFYYANVRTRESRWERPEVSPFFLEESVAIYFTATELHHLKALFKSEQKKFGAISVLGFRESLIQVGESEITDQQLTVLFQNFLRNKESNIKVDGVVSWIQFIDIMRCLKKMRMKKNAGVTKYINSLFTPPVETKVKNRTVQIADRRRRNIRRPKVFGDW